MRSFHGPVFSDETFLEAAERIAVDNPLADTGDEIVVIHYRNPENERDCEVFTLDREGEVVPMIDDFEPCGECGDEKCEVEHTDDERFDPREP